LTSSKLWLITGGAGYIGSHISNTLFRLGYKILVLDDLSTGNLKNLEPRIKLIIGDIGDKALLEDLFSKNQFFGVLHLAAKKNALESNAKKEVYELVNIISTKLLLTAALKNNVKNIIFSSSAAVYGNPTDILKSHENCHLAPINYYGITKLVIEEFLNELQSIFDFNLVIFRYFNVVGFSQSYLDFTNGVNLVSKLIESIKYEKKFRIYGKNLNTKDGTPIRDYVNVLDLVSAHVEVINQLINQVPPSNLTLNLGSGEGKSVLEVIEKFQTKIGRAIDFEFVSNRIGEPTSIVSDSSLANISLNWYPNTDPFSLIGLGNI
jgi:UDP-glucose 4-epimerase